MKNTLLLIFVLLASSAAYSQNWTYNFSDTLKNKTFVVFDSLTDPHHFWNIYSEEEKEAFVDSKTETVESLLETSQSRTIISAKEGDRVLGYGVFRKKNDTVVWISSLYVDPESQGKGIGSSLLKEIEMFAKEYDCKVVALETHRDASWAINFYLKHGYEIVNDAIDTFPFNQILEKPPVPNRPLIAKVIFV